MISLILLVFAIVLFAIAAWGVQSPRFNLIAAGLAFLSFSLLFEGIGPKL
jgi:hypothetical protein